MKAITMRRMSLGGFVVMVAMLGLPFLVSAAGPWDTTGSYVVQFVLGGTYDHDMTLTQSGTAITGVGGGYPAGGSYVYTWVIDSGSVIGDAVSLVAHYTGGADAVTPLTTMYMTGTIAGDGTMSGTWTDNYQGGARAGTWSTAEGAATALDTDEDGVLDSADICIDDTEADGAWQREWGVNRWQVQEGQNGLMWYQNKMKKGTAVPTATYPLSYTYGCNGHQILTMLTDELGDVMLGHYKFGLSSSVVEDFHKDLSDRVLDGRYLVETVSVPANDADGVMSTLSLMSGESYDIVVSGTAYACNQPGCVIQFDAEYSTSDGGTTWVDGVAAPYASYGVNLLDLMVDGGLVDWGSYTSGHTYTTPYLGTGAPVTLFVNDLAGSHVNNNGALTATIYANI